jgi:hypothetical protein
MTRLVGVILGCLLVCWLTIFLLERFIYYY